MILKEFEPLWKWVMERSQQGVMTVQERHELEHVFNLANGSTSYLEVGTAEGNSLYVMAHAAKYCVSLDYGEEHTRGAVNDVVKTLKSSPDAGNVSCVRANSHNRQTMQTIQAYRSFDCVMIDAGHTYEDVIADAIAYGGLATKYIFFHDIRLPAVKKAVEWYVAQQGMQDRYSEFVNSESFGYGILKLC